MIWKSFSNLNSTILLYNKRKEKDNSEINLSSGFMSLPFFVVGNIILNIKYIRRVCIF